MAGTHALIGIGEGLITAGVLGAVLAVRPDLVHGARILGINRTDTTSLGRRTVTLFVVGGVAVAVLLVAVVAPLASDDPDGLERVAIDQGFADDEQGHSLGDSPLAGYDVEGVDDDRVGTVVSGLIGLGVTFVAGMMFMLAVRHRRVGSRR